MDVYDNFALAPLDDPPEWEGDDSLPLDDPLRTDLPQVRFLTATSTPTLVVPFRPCAPGAVGNLVYALKRMHARFRGGGRLLRLMAKPPAVRRTWSFYLGPGSFTRDFRETRRLLGLPLTPTVYDDDAWRKLAPYADAFTLSLLAPYQNSQINRQIGWHMELYNRRAQVAYSQARPSQLGKPTSISRADCSGSIAAGCDWAKVLPQIDWRWTNTWSQVKMGKLVPSIIQARPGDIFFYGSPSHEAIYLGGGRVWSFGSYPIKILDYRYRDDFNQIRRFLPI